MVRVRPRVAVFFCFHRNLSITGPKKLECLLELSDCLRKGNLRRRLRRKRCCWANLLKHIAFSTFSLLSPSSNLYVL